MRRTGPAIIWILSLTACGENSVPPTAPAALNAATALRSYYEEGSQQPPEGVGPEFQVPTSIGVLADAGWRYGNAYAGVIVEYTATHVLARATVTTDVGSNSHEESDWQLAPAKRDYLLQNEPIVHMPQCQGIIRGTGYGKAWNETLVRTNVVKWGEKVGTDTKIYECPRATTGTPRSSGENSCYDLYVDHYWYYPQSGRVEYRYTEVYRICENAE